MKNSYHLMVLLAGIGEAVYANSRTSSIPLALFVFFLARFYVVGLIAIFAMSPEVPERLHIHPRSKPGRLVLGAPRAAVPIPWRP